MDDHRFETRQIHANGPTDEHGALMTPIYANSTYAYRTPSEPYGEHRYSRMSEPTRDALEANMAAIEGGDHASAFASGMAAIDAVFSLLSPGDHVVAGRNLYAETHELLADVYAEYRIETARVDVTDTDEIAAAIRPETELVYLETPTNPMLRIADIEATARIAADHNALLAVDNTFASPALQRPLELGADLVIESLTKYVGGHSDLIAGVVATTDAEVAEAIDCVQYARGAIPGSFESFLALRGTKTLSARMDRHCENTTIIAESLVDHPGVECVHYPGLDSHPNHEVAARQMDGFGGMVSFELVGGRETVTTFAEHVEVFTLAESLGGVESLVEVPAVMTHQDLSPAELEAAGIGETLVRLSVGIEHPADLVGDLERAIEAAVE
jgi:cystathionine gamma-lyase